MDIVCLGEQRKNTSGSYFAYILKKKKVFFFLYQEFLLCDFFKHLNTFSPKFLLFQKFYSNFYFLFPLLY